METVFLVATAAGGTLLVCQFLAGMLGFGHHDVGGGEHDFGHDHASGGDHDHDSNWFVGMLTFRTIVAALTFFGLGGLVASESHEDPWTTGAIATACGAAALLTVGWLMKSLHRLKSDGTARIDRAVGEMGTVYLSIPGQKAGAGKVTIKLQNRTVEYLAVTSHDRLPAGTQVEVVAVLAPETVEVIPVPQPERIAHV